MRMREIDAAGMYDTAAEAMGKVFVTTELRGGGTATARSVGIARRGVANVLRHAGIVAGVVEPAATRWLDMPSADCFGFAEQEGLVEPCADLGDPVRRGEVLARIHPIGRTGAAPAEHRAALDGILAARHFPGLAKPGDCLTVIATVEEPIPSPGQRSRWMMNRLLQCGIAAFAIMIGVAAGAARHDAAGK